jgi:YggT family protein
MPAPIENALIFLVNALFDIYLFILVIRLILVWVGANYFDPITQFIVKMTDFIVKPIRRRIPNVQRVEIATLIVILLLEICKFSFFTLLSAGVFNMGGILLLSMGDILKQIIQAFFYAIILQIILSWVQPASNASYLLMQVTAPIIRPLHRLVPNVGGFDITPIPALLLLQLLQIIIVQPILAMGYGVVFS